MKEKKKIAILTPTREGLVDISYSNSLIATMKLLGDEYDIQPTLVSGISDIVQGRNRLFNLWIKSDADYCLWVDSDISWNPVDLKSMLDSPCSVIAVNYPKKANDYKSFLQFASMLQQHTGEIDVEKALEASYSYTSTGKHNKYGEGEFKGLMSVGGIGMGFFLMHRSAAEPLLDWASTNMQKVNMATLTGKAIDGYPFFNHIVDDEYGDNGSLECFGEDFSFCKRLGYAGLKIFIDPNIRLRHSGYSVYDGKFSSFVELVEISQKLGIEIDSADYIFNDKIMGSDNDKK